MPASALRQLIERGTRRDAKARTILYREGDAPMVVLVVHGAGVFGVLATADERRRLTRRHLTFLRAFADQCTIAIDNARTTPKLRA